MVLSAFGRSIQACLLPAGPFPQKAGGRSMTNEFFSLKLNLKSKTVANFHSPRHRTELIIFEKPKIEQK
jgi:hypothetical protein